MRNRKSVLATLALVCASWFNGGCWLDGANEGIQSGVEAVVSTVIETVFSNILTPVLDGGGAAE